MSNRFHSSVSALAPVASLASAASLALLASASPALAQSNAPAPDSVLLETIDVRSSEGRPRLGVPTFAQQERRFIRRPGAETVVSVREQDPGTRGNIRSVLDLTPGVFAPERTAGSQNLISIRGSDIASNGPRNGRGVRAYIDGIPIGRTDAGVTNAFLDPLSADYIEIYRGGSSLRFGSLSTGGAINIVSKTGRTAPGSSITVSGGSYGNFQTQIENGGVKDAFDWHIQTNAFHNTGWQQHTREFNGRGSANFGYKPNEDFENRTYIAVGSTNQELSATVPLNQLHTPRARLSDTFTQRSDTDANFQYQRFANKTTMRFDKTSVELGFYALNTAFDHLPTPFSGFTDNHWRDYGASLRVEHKNTFFGLPTEIVGGARLNKTDGDFKRWRWTNGGRTKGVQVGDWDFNSILAETYGEASVEVLPKVRLFTGAQALYTTRKSVSKYNGPVLLPIGPFGPGGPQPGSAGGSYDRDFTAFNPKFGANWEYQKNHFLFANVTRSFEAPTSGDITDQLGVTGASTIKAQSAWTAEIGVRGGWERFQYDATLYHMALRNELLTKCGPAPGCATTVAFNAGKTIHQGIELGLKTIPFQNIVQDGDQVFLNMVWNYTNFRFDGDSIFGSNQLPVIPRNQVFGELGYRMANGLFGSVNLRHLSERKTTFNGSGGAAFTVPAYALLGAKIGWKSQDGTWSAFAEGRNLTNKRFVSEFSATPTATGASPLVRAGDGRGYYAGLTRRF